MSYRPLEIPDIEQRASERATRTRKSRSEEAEKRDRALYRPELTEKQTEFLALFETCSFMPLSKLCSQVGIRIPTLEKWKAESEDFRKALTIHYNRMLQATNMSRQQVMKGILEAIDMAKDQRQPNSMITGWKEIGRMCGFYEPERREITVSVDGKQMLEDLKTVSREKLLELANQQDIIEGELVGDSEIRD